MRQLYDAAESYRTLRRELNEQFGSSLKAPADQAARLNDLFEHAHDCERALAQMPAPDLEALRWKFEHLLEPDDGDAIPNWSCWYIKQTVEDFRRMLPDDGKRPQMRSL